LRSTRAIILFLTVLAACNEAPMPVADDALPRRIVALAPNLTELAYAAGAGDLLVGVSAYSDYPAEALSLPIVGDAFMIDQEQLALLNPDLLLVWEAGTAPRVVDELRNLGYPVELVRTNSLDDVSSAMMRIGELTGREASARHAVADYEERLAEFRRYPTGEGDIRVFYQVSARPLYTVNGEHYVSELISICGGINVFENLGELAPTVDVEAVVERDPEVLLTSSDAEDDAFSEWSRWPDIAANRYANHFRLPADTIGRATPRLAQAAEAVCDALDEARHRRGNVD
jgi:iron complex transport system substrate-binding protein